jgi:hypothetical protein
MCPHPTRHFDTMDSREIHIHYEKPRSVGQSPLDGRGAICDFEYGPRVREMLV